jgi:single-strand DNA-binding protein
MARGVNKVILIGNLGDEPSFRNTNSGTAVANISMVTNEMRRNVETGQTTELAEWHRVVMWGKLAEIAKQWLHKGSQIYIEGKLRTRSYTDKQNIKRTVTEIVADEMQMLGGSSKAGSENEPTHNYANAGNNQGYGQSNFQNSDNSGYGDRNYQNHNAQISGMNNQNPPITIDEKDNDDMPF